MNRPGNKATLYLHAITLLAALVILIDFTLPGKVFTEDVINIKKERQQYYNAARNYHYSYKVITNEHQFSVAEEFAKLAKNQKNIEFAVSRLFKEVNWYRLLSSDKKAVYSLRIVSGLILPLLIIISLVVAYRYKKKISTLILILQILLLADLIFLII